MVKRWGNGWNGVKRRRIKNERNGVRVKEVKGRKWRRGWRVWWGEGGRSRWELRIWKSVVLYRRL